MGLQDGASALASQNSKGVLGYFFKCLKMYVVFSGRARRMEYWSFCLVQFIIFAVFGVIQTVLLKIGIPPVITPILSLLFLLPSLGAAVRRMHDVDKSGWFVLIPIYNIVLLFTDGTRGGNRFGADPKQI